MLRCWMQHLRFCFSNVIWSRQMHYAGSQSTEKFALFAHFKQTKVTEFQLFVVGAFHLPFLFLLLQWSAQLIHNNPQKSHFQYGLNTTESIIQWIFIAKDKTRNWILIRFMISQTPTLDANQFTNVCMWFSTDNQCSFLCSRAQLTHRCRIICKSKIDKSETQTTMGVNGAVNKCQVSKAHRLNQHNDDTIWKGFAVDIQIIIRL